MGAVNFDNTYITFAGIHIFEPLVLLTNSILFLIGIWFYLKLRKTTGEYNRRKSNFILMLGISSVLGGLAHAIHEQVGSVFLKLIIAACHLFSLVSAYYCLLGSYQLYVQTEGKANYWVKRIAISWFSLVLIWVAYTNQFAIITAHAGLVLMFALWVHLRAMKMDYTGSGYVAAGISTSFISVGVHLSKFSLHEWFNYKDIAHVFMIVALIFIGKGLVKSSQEEFADQETEIVNS